MSSGGGYASRSLEKNSLGRYHFADTPWAFPRENPAPLLEVPILLIQNRKFRFGQNRKFRFFGYLYSTIQRKDFQKNERVYNEVAERK